MHSTMPAFIHQKGIPTGMPVNYVMQQVIAWGIGFLSVAGLLVYLKGRTDTAKIAAYALAAASAIGGVLYMFFW